MLDLWKERKMCDKRVFFGNISKCVHFDGGKRETKTGKVWETEVEKYLKKKKIKYLFQISFHKLLQIFIFLELKKVKLKKHNKSSAVI